MTMPHQSFKRFWQQNIAVKLTAIQALVALFIIATTLWVLLGIAQNNQNNQLERQNLQLGHLVVSELNSVTFQISALVQMMATTAEIYQQQPQTLAISVPALLSMESQQTLIVGGGIWPAQRSENNNSLFFARNSANKLLINNDYNQKNAKDYRQEPWYLAASLLPRGKVYWSQSYLDPHTLEPMVTASAPIWSHHQLLGVASVDLSLQGLSKYLNQQLKHQSGYVLIADNFQHILAKPLGLTELAKQATNLTELSQALPQYQSLLNRINHVHTRLMAATIPLDDQALFDKTFKHFPAEQRQILSHRLAWHLNATAPSSLPLAQFEQDDPLFNDKSNVSILMMPNTYWQVITFTPNSLLAGNARHIVDQVGIYLILIQIIALISLFVALNKVLVVPLRLLVNALTNNRHEQLEISGNRPDELGTLARALVGQTQQLDKAIASLEASQAALEEELAVHQQLQAHYMRGCTYHNALMASNELLYSVKDLSGKHIALNAGLCQLLEQESQAFVGLTNQAIFPEKIAQIEDRQDLRARDSLAMVRYHLQLTILGEIIHFQMCKIPVLDDQGEMTAIITLAIKLS